MASAGCEDLIQQETTDVESLDGTLASLNVSSITRLPHSSSETEFETDEKTVDVDELVEEFCSASGNKLSKPTKGKNVARWLNTSADDSQFDVASNFQCNFARVDIEKTAAILIDSIKNKKFAPSDWIEVEQQVPSSSAKSNFFNEAKDKPGLTLMYCIKSYCNGENDSLYMKLLQSACQNATTSESHNSSLDKRKFRTDTLKTFNEGTYFSKLSLHFIRLPRNRRPLVKAVEIFVTSEIQKAKEKNSPVLFTRYSGIPDVVEKCNVDYDLGFGPDKLAKYGIALQHAVYQDMTGRCLEFLGHVGFNMLSEEDSNRGQNLNLSSNESGLSQQFSSQGSQNDSDIASPFSSQRSNLVEDIEIGNEYPFVHLNEELNEGAFDDPHNPRLIDVEILRGYPHAADNSPGGSQQSQQSQQSYNSYDTSSPQYSLPERERQPVSSMEIENNYHAQDLVDMEEFVVINYEDLQDIAFAEEAAEEADDEDEGPRRRRRRLV